LVSKTKIRPLAGLHYRLVNVVISRSLEVEGKGLKKFGRALEN